MPDVRACVCVMGAAQGTADHMLGGRERNEGCPAGLLVCKIPCGGTMITG